MNDSDVPTDRPQPELRLIRPGDRPDAADPASLAEQARQQTGRHAARLRIDDSELRTGYVNSFRATPGDEDVAVDFGQNVEIPAPVPDAPPAVLFKVAERVFMNYCSAKRLALALGRLIRRHESRFGEIDVDAERDVRPQ